MLANLQEEGQRDQVLIYNNKTLNGLEKIKDILNDGAVVTVQSDREKKKKLIATNKTTGTQTRLHVQQSTPKTINNHKMEQSEEI